MEILKIHLEEQVLIKFHFGGMKNVNMTDQQLAEKLHKPIVKNFKKRKVRSFFKDNTWDAGLSDINK